MSQEILNTNTIFDGYGLIYRSYFAFLNNPLINEKGQNISSLYGFIRILLKFIREWKPASIVIAMDSSVPTFRHKIFSDYKANRDKMPDDLRLQIPLLKEFFTTAAIPHLEYPGMEADDIMGTLAETWQKFDETILLVTSDKDAYQLVDAKVRILAPQKGLSSFVVHDKSSISKKLGISQGQVVDYMAIVGDSSDNIPGVKGIGPKGAIGLLQNYANLDEIFENLEKISPEGIRQKLTESKENAFLSRKLATIQRDLDITINPQPVRLDKIYSEKTLQFLKSQGIASIAREIEEEIQKTTGKKFISNTALTTAKKRNYSLIKDKSDFSQLLKKIYNHKGLIAIDTETTSPEPCQAELIGLSFSIKEGEAFYIHLSDKSLTKTGLSWQAILPELSKIITLPNLKFVGQNYKYDYIVLKRHGLILPEAYMDTMIASYLLAPGERRHNLETIARLFLNEDMISFAELTGTGKKKVPIEQVALEKLTEYAAEDADMTLRLGKILEKKTKGK